MVGASLSLHNDSMCSVLELLPSYRRGNEGSDMGSHWLKDVQ